MKFYVTVAMRLSLLVNWSNRDRHLISKMMLTDQLLVQLYPNVMKAKRKADDVSPLFRLNCLVVNMKGKYKFN